MWGKVKFERDHREINDSTWRIKKENTLRSKLMEYYSKIIKILSQATTTGHKGSYKRRIRAKKIKGIIGYSLSKLLNGIVIEIN